MRICHIVGAGERTRLDITEKAGDYVVACDAGYRYLSETGIVPDMIIGDFDSLGFVPDGTNVVVLQSEKDVTDVGAAIELTLDKGFDEYRLWCCTGGSLAHTLANIQCAAAIARRKKRVFLIGAEENVTAVDGGALTFGEGKGYISVFSCGNADGVTLTGLKYHLLDYSMSDGYPIGVSNEFIGKEATVSVKKGTLIVVYPSTVDFPKTLWLPTV